MKSSHNPSRQGLQLHPKTYEAVHECSWSMMQIITKDCIVGLLNYLLTWLPNYLITGERERKTERRCSTTSQSGIQGGVIIINLLDLAYTLGLDELIQQCYSFTNSAKPRWDWQGEKDSNSCVIQKKKRKKTKDKLSQLSQFFGDILVTRIAIKKIGLPKENNCVA